jgi:predicted peptidase
VNENRYPAFVVFPQCNERSWTGANEERFFQPGAMVPPESDKEILVMRLIDELLANYPIDTTRIYIMGLSMGAIAVYDLVCRYPDRFAAAVPICGAVNPSRLSSAAEVDFMIFHGSDDKEIPSICSRNAYKTLTAEGAEVSYVEFAGVEHDCWSMALNYPDLLMWLFSKHR